MPQTVTNSKQQSIVGAEKPLRGFEPDKTSAFKIDRGIPLAKRMGHGGSGRPEVYPFGKLEVGESFFVPSKARAFHAAAMAAGRHKRKFATRCVTENGVRGFRVWRTA